MKLRIKYSDTKKIYMIRGGTDRFGSNYFKEYCLISNYFIKNKDLMELVQMKKDELVLTNQKDYKHEDIENICREMFYTFYEQLIKCLGGWIPSMDDLNYQFHIGGYLAFGDFHLCSWEFERLDNDLINDLIEIALKKMNPMSILDQSKVNLESLDKMHLIKEKIKHKEQDICVIENENK